MEIKLNKEYFDKGTERLNMDYLFYIEHLKDNIIIENNNKSNIEIIPIKFLLIEDGSVNENELKKLNVPYLIYRQGANKPEIIEM